MTGIFALKTENHKLDSFDKAIEVFVHMESVQKTQSILKQYLLPDTELNLMDYRLNQIPLVSNGYRFEALGSRQRNLELRCEGMLATAWEKIKAFFRWLKEKFMSLFKGADGTSEPKGQPVTSQAEKNISKAIETFSKQAKTKDIEATAKLLKVPEGSAVKNEKATQAYIDAIQRTAKVSKSLVADLEDLSGKVKNPNEFQNNTKAIVQELRLFVGRVEGSVIQVKVSASDAIYEETKKNLGNFGSSMFEKDVREAAGSKISGENIGFVYLGPKKIHVWDFDDQNKKINFGIVKEANADNNSENTGENLIKLFDAGVFSYLETLSKEAMDSYDKLGKKLEAVCNLAESSVSEIKDSENKEAQIKYKLVMDILRESLSIMTSFRTWLVFLNKNVERARHCMEPILDLDAPISPEDILLATEIKK